MVSVVEQAIETERAWTMALERVSYGVSHRPDLVRLGH